MSLQDYMRGYGEALAAVQTEVTRLQNANDTKHTEASEREAAGLRELPPLPEKLAVFHQDWGPECAVGYTAEQMQAYARLHEAEVTRRLAEKHASTIEAMAPHQWVDGSDQWGNPCPAKVVTTRADYANAIRRSALSAEPGEKT